MAGKSPSIRCILTVLANPTHQAINPHVCCAFARKRARLKRRERMLSIRSARRERPSMSTHKAQHAKAKQVYTINTTHKGQHTKAKHVYIQRPTHKGRACKHKTQHTKAKHVYTQNTHLNINVVPAFPEDGNIMLPLLPTMLAMLPLAPPPPPGALERLPRLV